MQHHLLRLLPSPAISIKAELIRGYSTTEEQPVFSKGLGSLEASCQKTYNRSFMALNPIERETFITQLDQAAHLPKSESESAHYFTMIKQLTLFRFFTSEVGATQVLRHMPVPGHYDGAMPYEEGDGAWATR